MISSDVCVFHFRLLVSFSPSSLALVTISSGFPLSTIGSKSEVVFENPILKSLHLVSLS